VVPYIVYHHVSQRLKEHNEETSHNRNIENIRVVLNTIFEPPFDTVFFSVQGIHVVNTQRNCVFRTFRVLRIFYYFTLKWKIGRKYVPRRCQELAVTSPCLPTLVDSVKCIALSVRWSCVLFIGCFAVK
jgi:hypothetical protein